MKSVTCYRTHKNCNGSECTVKLERVLWGKHPSHGAQWLKLTANASQKAKKSRENDGWELAELSTGEHPDTGKRLPLYPRRSVKK